MTTNTSTTITEPRTAPHPLAQAAFVAGPLVLLVGRLLLEPLGDEDWDQTLTAVAAHRGRSDAGWLLALAGSALMAHASSCYVQRISGRNRTLTATVMSLLLPLGWTACSAICVAGLAMGAAAVRPERSVMIAWQESMNSSASVGILFAVTVLAGLGYLWLAVAFARRTDTGRIAATLIGLGGLSTLVTTPGPVRPVLIATAVLLAAGHGLVVRSLGTSAAPAHADPDTSRAETK